MEEPEKGKGNQRQNAAIANLTELSSNLNSMEKLLVKSAVYVDPNTYNRASVISEQSRTIKVLDEMTKRF